MCVGLSLQTCPPRPATQSGPWLLCLLPDVGDTMRAPGLSNIPDESSPKTCNHQKGGPLAARYARDLRHGPLTVGLRFSEITIIDVAPMGLSALRRGYPHLKWLGPSPLSASSCCVFLGFNHVSWGGLRKFTLACFFLLRVLGCGRR